MRLARPETSALTRPEKARESLRRRDFKMGDRIHVSNDENRCRDRSAIFELMSNE